MSKMLNRQHMGGASLPGWYGYIHQPFNISKIQTTLHHQVNNESSMSGSMSSHIPGIRYILYITNQYMYHITISLENKNIVFSNFLPSQYKYLKASPSPLAVLINYQLLSSLSFLQYGFLQPTQRSRRHTICM